MQTGLGAPGAVRLEAPAPFGAPLFILAAPNERGTLLLPRDRRVLYDAAVREILDALVGIALGAADLRALLSGCVIPDPRPQAGREYTGGLVAIDVQDGGVAWLRNINGQWQTVAGQHAGLFVEYSGNATANALPNSVRVSAMAGSNARELDLRITLSQVEINVPLSTEVFTVEVPPGTTPITLEELRRVGPLARP